MKFIEELETKLEISEMIEWFKFKRDFQVKKLSAHNRNGRSGKSLLSYDDRERIIADYDDRISRLTNMLREANLDVLLK